MARNYTVTLSCEPEDEGPDGYLDSGDAAQDAQDVAAIREAMEWNEWAWCTAVVTVTDDESGFAEVEYLGSCSYTDADDFRRTSGYEDMVQDATDRLADRLRTLAASLEACPA